MDLDHVTVAEQEMTLVSMSDAQQGLFTELSSTAHRWQRESDLTLAEINCVIAFYAMVGAVAIATPIVGGHNGEEVAP